MKKLELKNVKGSYDYESKDQIIRNYISDTLSIAVNKNMSLPYKRYEIGKVFRDGPVKQGTVFEVYQTNGEVKSSIVGGGRYDKMIGNFIGDGKKYPAVGISFGLDVIFDILKAKGNLKNTNIDVYIIPMQNKVQALKIATDLRKQDINVDIEMNNKKLKKALNYANIEEIPSVIIIGDDELKEDKVILKNMQTGSQIKVKIEEIAKNLENIDKSLNYKILNPGGNKTAIVIGNEYSNEDKKKINDKILEENSDVEQVGFISKKENKLEMAGGEFCMNRSKMCNMGISKRESRRNRIKCFRL